jgi:hypothetical protein
MVKTGEAPTMARKKSRRPAFRVKTEQRETQFKALRELESFEAVRDRLLAGWTIASLVHFIHEELEEGKEIAPTALFQMLERYRKTIPPADFVSQQPPGDLVQQRMSKVHQRAIKKLKEGLNELDELQSLYETQLERIEIDLTAEKKNGKLFPSMSQEVRIAKELLESSSRLKHELGLTKKQLGQLDVEARFVQDAKGKFGNASVQRVLQNPEQRRRVLGLAERFLALQPGEEEPTESEEVPEKKAAEGGGS